MQLPDFSVGALNKKLQATRNYLQRYHDTGFESASTNTHEIAEDMDVDTAVSEMRNQRRKAHLTIKVWTNAIK